MRLAKHFAKRGTPRQASLIEEDLGISSSAGRKNRAVRAWNARIILSKRRAQQGQRRARANAAAAYARPPPDHAPKLITLYVRTTRFHASTPAGWSQASPRRRRDTAPKKKANMHMLLHGTMTDMCDRYVSVTDDRAAGLRTRAAGWARRTSRRGPRSR